jgi:peptidoglycan/xylan/chitin deacetylase (PgdA/CDA1 family)
MTSPLRSFLARPVRRIVKRTGSALLGIRTGLPPQSGAVALTFDDGPDPVYTPAVLDLLATLGVQATFFCVGYRVDRHPDLVRRMVREGHGVGSHSHSHEAPGNVSLGSRTFEFRAGRKSVECATGRRTRLFRPPQGFLGADTMPAIVLAGLRPWLYTVDPEDWRPGASADAIAASVSSAASGDVVLLHDGLELPVAPSALDRSATIGALPVIVRALRNRGLTFAVLPPS